jgi:peptidyl-prolyl cis-trans isomerase C
MERSSDSATRFSGGDIGGYFTLDVMPRTLCGRPQGRSSPASWSGPSPSRGGWALVKVEEMRQEAPITFEAARPQIVRFLTYDKVRDLLEKLRGAARGSAAAAQDPGSARRPARAGVRPARPDGDGGPRTAAAAAAPRRHSPPRRRPPRPPPPATPREEMTKPPSRPKTAGAS